MKVEINLIALIVLYCIVQLSAFAHSLEVKSDVCSLSFALNSHLRYHQPVKYDIMWILRRLL